MPCSEKRLTDKVCPIIIRKKLKQKLKQDIPRNGVNTRRAIFISNHLGESLCVHNRNKTTLETQSTVQKSLTISKSITNHQVLPLLHYWQQLITTYYLFLNRNEKEWNSTISLNLSTVQPLLISFLCLCAECAYLA